MRRWLVIWIVFCLVTGATGLTCVQASGAESKKASITGIYDVIFTTDQGQQQSAKIRIEDLKNGKVEASGDYLGYPISIIGDLTGDVEKGGAVCSFTINKSGLVSGSAEITIQMAGDKYQLQGQGRGTYSYLGTSGTVSGRVEGSRPNPAATSAPSSHRTTALIIGLIFFMVMLIYIVWWRRARKVRN